MSLQPAFRRSVFLLLLLVTLSFGWWPYSFRRENDVKWHEEAKAIRFNEGYELGDDASRGTAYNIEELDTRGWEGITLVVELRARPRGNGLSVFLEFFENVSEKFKPLVLGQWKEHLVVLSREQFDSGEIAYSEIGHKDCFKSGDFFQVVLVSKGDRTLLYIDGNLEEARSRFSLLDVDNKFLGGFSLGSSLDGASPFLGEIRKVALYDKAVRPGTKAFLEAIPKLLLDGDVIARTATPGKELDVAREALAIPRHYTPKRRMFFGPVLPAFQIKASSLAQDMIVNSLGFIPIGLCFAAAIRRRFRSPAALIVGVGVCSFLLSFGIEYGQGYLVHRDSSVLDLILNTGSGMLALVVPKKWVLFL